MAELVLGMATSHSPLLSIPGEHWQEYAKFDPTIREFEITDSGIIVGQPFEGVEAVLSGTAREAGQHPPRSGCAAWPPCSSPRMSRPWRSAWTSVRLDGGIGA